MIRLVYNKKLSQHNKNDLELINQVIVLLLLTWNDQRLAQNGGFETIQILSTFFRQMVLSPDHIFLFEKALETVIEL